MGFRMVHSVKTCSKCNIEYPETTEYFYAYGQNKNGLRPQCKDCLRNFQLNYLNSMSPEERYEMKRAEQQRNKHIYRQATRKVVARRRGVHHEDWTEKQLLETYGTDCYICHEPIDFNAPRVGQGSDRSLWPDHVIPMSRGGENTIRNVRPCHSMCNRTKSTKTYDEYMLTGNSQDIVTQS